MSGGFLSKLARIRSDACGASLIEFCIVAPLLLVFFTGIVDLARGYSEKHRLKQVIDRALERAQANSRDGDFTYVQTEATAEAGPGRVVVFDQWTECNGNRQAVADSCDTGESSRFVKLTITSSFSPMFGAIGYPAANADGTVPIIAKGTLRVR